MVHVGNRNSIDCDESKMMEYFALSSLPVKTRDVGDHRLWQGDQWIASEKMGAPIKAVSLDTSVWLPRFLRIPVHTLDHQGCTGPEVLFWYPEFVSKNVSNLGCHVYV